MTRKDYVLIAEAFRSRMTAETAKMGTEGMTALEGSFGRTAIDRLAQTLATALKSENRNFDRERFLEACGLFDN